MLQPHNGTRTIKTLVPVVTVEVIEIVTVALVEKEVKLELRAWEANEIPIGALFQSPYRKYPQRITGYDPSYSNVHSPAIILSGGKYESDNHYFTQDLVTSYGEPKYSWDGVNWFRCGTWVEAK